MKVILVLIAMLLLVACQAQTPKQKTETQAPSRKNFSVLPDILSAYADGNADQSFTQLDLRKKIYGLEEDVFLPTTRAVFIDEDDIIQIDSSRKFFALLVGRFVVTSSEVSNIPVLTDNDLPPPLRGKNLRLGIMVKLLETPDGLRHEELLGESIAKNDILGLEIFEMSKNSTYPYPSSFDIEISDLRDLSPADRLVFYGNKNLKRASISSIDYDRGLIAMNGTIAVGNNDAPVFSLRCGKQRLVGFVWTSYGLLGRETEASVRALGTQSVADFIMENTSIDISAQKNTDPCPKPNFALKERLISALSDGLYDLSYDMADLKNPDFEKLQEFSPQLQNFRVSEDKFEQNRVISSGRALLVDNYVVVVEPLIQNDPSPRFSYRLFWGDDMINEHTDESKYENLELIGFDSLKKIALFKRPDNTKFPIPDGIPFNMGNSDELEIGNVLYSIGASDISFNSEFVILQKSVDPASVIGFLPGYDDRFYFQGSMGQGEGDRSTLLFAIRDGELEIVGIFYDRLDDPKDETLGTALTIEFVQKAIAEIKCANLKISCRSPALLVTGGKFSVAFFGQAGKDRDQLISLLKDGSPDESGLLTDIIRPNIKNVSQFERRIIILFYDEDGKIVESSSGEALILSDEYVLTLASFFPTRIVESGSQKILDTSDVTSNTIPSNKYGNLEARIYLTDEFSLELAYRDEPEDKSEIETLKIVIIDRENGYALLRRPVSPSADPSNVKQTDIPDIAPSEKLGPNQEILISFSKDIFISKEFFLRSKFVSAGAIIDASPESQIFTFNGFASPQNLGSPIYVKQDGKIILAGIILGNDIWYPEEIRTEGTALSIDFIFQKIKEKTGIDFLVK